MTAEKFIQSFYSHRTGDKGYCRLATVSTEYGNFGYDVGFWFEILRSNGSAMLLSVKSESRTRQPYTKTILIKGIMQMRAFIDKLREKAQDELYSFLLRPELYKDNVRLAPEKRHQCA